MPIIDELFDDPAAEPEDDEENEDEFLDETDRIIDVGYIYMTELEYPSLYEGRLCFRVSEGF